MFKPKNYADIFDRRGASYHRAMLECPGARAEEFVRLLDTAAVKPESIVADFPAGGAYLYPYLAQRGVIPQQYFPLETSRYFFDLNDFVNAELHDESKPQLGSKRFDCLLSLAGLHHVDNRELYYREFFNALNPGGDIVIADVMCGTPVDEFLNGFVHTHSALGHEGDFLTERDLDALSQAGFENVGGALEVVTWRFPDRGARARFCQQLFGVDARTDEIDECLVSLFGAQGAELPWQLYFMRGTKC